MERITEIIPAAAVDPATVRATVTLAFHDRYRRRFRLALDGGGAVVLDLEKARLLGDGDGLVLGDGGVVQVVAAPEAVVDLTARDPVHAARLAWHIGNRHCPLQVLSDGTLRIAEDHVLVEMAAGLGADVTRRQAPFAPEAGAYGGGHGH